MMKNETEDVEIKNIKAIAMLIGAMVLAGSSVVVGKILVHAMPVFIATFGSLLVAFFCMIPLMRNRMNELRHLTLYQWKYLFLQGLCGIVLFRVFTLYGLHSTGAVQAGIITGATPAVLALLAFLFLQERLTIYSIMGIALGVSGCIVINIFSAHADNDNSVSGCLLIGAAVICEALFTIFRKRLSTTVSATTNTTVLIFCSLLLLAVPAALDVRSMQSMPEFHSVIAVGYYGVFATVIAYLLWTSAVVKVNGAIAGTATAAMPASSVILAALFLHEQIYWHHLLGCLLIIAGIIITSRN